MEKSWIFPYGDIHKGAKVVVYAAGNVGKSFVNQILATKYCEIVAWVDSNYEYYQSLGFDVIEPKNIQQLEYDYIVIAVDNRNTANQIYKFLVDTKVSSEKIWSPFGKYIESDLELGHNFQTPFNIEHMKIAFFLPEVIKGGGGHRNIFRVISHMADKGHKIDVYYTDSNEEPDTVKNNVSTWFYDMRNVRFIRYEGKVGYYDAGIATWWETAYIVKNNVSHFKKIFYFVQDFEPYFYPMSSEYFLAENTYKFGFYHICSGAWCKKMLVEKYKANATSFQFPIDRTIYNQNYKRTKINKNIVFFAKPEMSRRCFKIGIDALKILKEKRSDIEIILYGSKQLSKKQVPFEATILNLLPTIKDLAVLYANADLGIVFSTTNPSLVPYEMMSCGCPVVDMDVENALSKYGDNENNVFLVDPLPETFAKQLEDIIDDNEKRELIRKSAKGWVAKEFPTETEMKEFVEKIIVEEMRGMIGEK